MTLTPEALAKIIDDYAQAQVAKAMDPEDLGEEIVAEKGGGSLADSIDYQRRWNAQQAKVAADAGAAKEAARLKAHAELGIFIPIPSMLAVHVPEYDEHASPLRNYENMGVACEALRALLDHRGRPDLFDDDRHRDDVDGHREFVVNRVANGDGLYIDQRVPVNVGVARWDHESVRVRHYVDPGSVVVVDSLLRPWVFAAEEWEADK